MYRKKELGEVTTLIKRGVTPKYVDEDGYTIINQRCIRDNRLTFDDSRLTHKKKTSIKPEKYVQKWDVLVNSTGVGTLGRTAQVVEDYENTTVDTHVTIVRPDLEKLYGRYLGYVMAHNERIIENLAKGATGQTELSRHLLSEIEITVPEYEQQQKIASTLSAFDDLIENNTRRIEILEEMARRIYREWFVHFRYPEHENDELVDSGTELGAIPEGWEVKQIQGIVDRSNSGLKPIDHPGEEFYYYSFSAYDEGQRPEVIKGEEIKSRKYILDDDAVIISKLNPRIPRIWYAKPKTDLRCLTSTEFLILNGIDGISNAFVYSLLSSHKFYGRFRSLTGGTSTSHQRVKPKDFKKMEIALPEKSLLNKFQNKAGQIFDLAHNLREKNEKLKKTRDFLLPKLISGKIEVEKIPV